jgi:hypothetical protein
VDFYPRLYQLKFSGSKRSFQHSTVWDGDDSFFVARLNVHMRLMVLFIVKVVHQNVLLRWSIDGCLISYGPDSVHQYRRAAHFVDKILKGTKPADIPVEQPMKFDLIFNLKTAKQIGLTIPPNVLARADRVMR